MFVPDNQKREEAKRETIKLCEQKYDEIVGDSGFGKFEITIENGKATISRIEKTKLIK